jgi:hypothetical protein
MQEGKPKIVINSGSPLRSGLAERSSFLEDESAKARDLKRYGLSKETIQIKGIEFPLIVELINNPPSSDWLREEVNYHGILAGNLPEVSMKYILLRIAGCSLDDLRDSFQIDPVNQRRYLPDINDTLSNILVKRKKFILENPELDWTKEKLGTRAIKSLPELLSIISKEIDLEATEIFDLDYIPDYIGRKRGVHSRSTEHRTLKGVLDEVVSVLTNPNWKDVTRLTGRSKGHMVESLTNSIWGNISKRNKMFTHKFIIKLCQKRTEFQKSPEARLYLTDRYDWQGVIDKINAGNK